MDLDLTPCARDILSFRDKRDWRQFHSPKNLAISISIEAAELLEIYQWKSDTDAAHVQQSVRLEVEDELADIAIYLILFCLDQKIDLKKAIERKISKNEKKYPVQKARGRADKYTKL